MGSMQGRMRNILSLSVGRFAVLALAGCATATAWGKRDGANTLPSTVDAPPSAVDASVVFDRVTVVDVEHGQLIPDQRVVITGNRITAVANTGAVKPPESARVVDARGKYLIPGLWDLHVHNIPVYNILNSFPSYLLFLANGITGFRDAGSPIPLDTLLQWRREILAGTRLGPPRQLLSGQSIENRRFGAECDRALMRTNLQICVADSADATWVVDSLKAAGADMVKPRDLTRKMHFIIAAAARRAGIPFGGHVQVATAIEASDSGIRIIDHLQGGSKRYNQLQIPDGLYALCLDAASASVAACRSVAERFRQNNTWWAPTTIYSLPSSLREWRGAAAVRARFIKEMKAFKAGTLLRGNWLRSSDSTGSPPARDSASSGRGGLAIARQANMPIVAGTDMVSTPWGFSLHAELAVYAAEGLTPLQALQTATLNPAKMWGATDSLGTVAPGKLADLVLLDANPLADITNTTTIRAVVANGRYFDRPTLDSLLTEVQNYGKIIPRLGMSVRQVTAEATEYFQLPSDIRGLYAREIDPNGPTWGRLQAAQARTREVDVIVAVDGKPVHTEAELRAMVHRVPPGGALALRLYSTKQRAEHIERIQLGK